MRRSERAPATRSWKGICVKLESREVEENEMVTPYRAGLRRGKVTGPLKPPASGRTHPGSHPHLHPYADLRLRSAPGIGPMVMALIAVVGIIVSGQTGSAAAEATTRSAQTANTIRADGTHLTLNGDTYRFTGVNAYEAATDYGINAGCGAMLSTAQLNQLFASMPRNSLVRIAVLQGSMATNVHTHQLDWGPLNRVFAVAARHDQRLIMTIANQGGTCDNMHWQDPSWYRGGFKDVFNDSSNTEGTGLTPLSYWSYLKDIVNQYKNSPACGDVGADIGTGGFQLPATGSANRLRRTSDVPERICGRGGTPVLLRYRGPGDPYPRSTPSGREWDVGRWPVRNGRFGLSVCFGEPGHRCPLLSRLLRDGPHGG